MEQKESYLWKRMVLKSKPSHAHSQHHVYVDRWDTEGTDSTTCHGRHLEQPGVQGRSINYKTIVREM